MNGSACAVRIAVNALKESTMKHIQRAIALFGLGLLLMASSALAQSNTQTRVNIPFSFVVGEKTLPAGEYVIRRNKRDSDTTWVIEPKTTGASVVLLTTTDRSTETPEKSTFVFNRYDDVYFLTAFWTAGSNTGREVQMSDREETMAKALAIKHEQVVLTGQGK
jgi:hypothetical protein